MYSNLSEGETHVFTPWLRQPSGPVVRRVVRNAIQRINRYPMDSVLRFVNTYLMDSNLSGGWRYPAFEQLGPGSPKFNTWGF